MSWRPGQARALHASGIALDAQVVCVDTPKCPQRGRRRGVNTHEILATNVWPECRACKRMMAYITEPPTPRETKVVLAEELEA